ncbi:MAG TPA: hypothetical protein VGK44_02630 [Casimicrobiaceae bacterium]
MDGTIDNSARLRALNRRTATILFAIALVFFGGIFVSHLFGGVAAGITVVSIAVVLYLAVAIGRNVRGGQ